MADKTTSYNRLSLLAGFADEDDRTITVDDPKTSINLAEAIHELEPIAAKVLIGDKHSATFTRFKEAKLVQGTRTELDIP